MWCLDADLRIRRRKKKSSDDVGGDVVRFGTMHKLFFQKRKNLKAVLPNILWRQSLVIITKGCCICHGQQIILRLIFLGRGLWPLTRTADSGTTTRRQTGSVPKPSSSFSLALQLITRLQRKTAITNERSGMVVSYVLPKKGRLEGKVVLWTHWLLSLVCCLRSLCKWCGNSPSVGSCSRS